jgi:hypothetical protein
MKTYVRFFALLEEYSINIYCREKHSQQVWEK